MKNKQLRYLVDCALYKATTTRQPNGYVTETHTKLSDYKVRIQEVDDEVSSSVYGAGITNLLRLSSLHGSLELELKSKLNDSADNITNYTVVMANKRYKILSVKNNWVDVQFSNMINYVS